MVELLYGVMVELLYGVGRRAAPHHLRDIAIAVVSRLDSTADAHMGLTPPPTRPGSIVSGLYSTAAASRLDSTASSSGLDSTAAATNFGHSYKFLQILDIPTSFYQFWKFELFSAI
jgi:hypothetical protein